MALSISTAGARATARWLSQRGFDVSRVPSWYAELTLFPTTSEANTRLDLNLYPEEWGFIVRVGGRVSSVRVTDVAFAHGRDDLELLAHTPIELDDLSRLVKLVEGRVGTTFDRADATVTSNLPRASSIIRAWLVAL